MDTKFKKREFAQLDLDPQLNSSKRIARTHQNALSSTLAQSSLERRLLTAQNAKLELEGKLREKDMLVERLERDRRWFAEREKEEREGRENERAENEELKRKSESELKNVKNALNGLQSTYYDLQDAHQSLSLSSQKTISSQSQEINALKRELAHLTAEQTHLNALLSSQTHSIQELSAQIEEMSVHRDDLERGARNAESTRVARAELDRQLAYLRKVEKENLKLTSEVLVLREREGNLAVLREEKRSLEGKLKGLEDMRHSLVRLQAEVDAARKEREEWALKTSSIPSTSTNSQTPISVTQTLSALRLQHAALLESHGALQTSLKQRETELALATSQNEELATKVGKMEKELGTMKGKILRRDQRIALGEREIGFLKALADSYASEAQVQAGERENEGEPDGKAQMTRLNELEALLGEYKEKNERLEKEIESRNSEESIKASTDEESAHLATIEALEQQLFELRGEIAAGRHTPPNVRVLEMEGNPAREWEAGRREVESRLKGENEALRRRLKDLEAGGAVVTTTETLEVAQEREEAGDLVPRESFEAVAKEKNELEDLIRREEVRRARLKEAYANNGHAFREAVASLLGYKFAFYPNGEIRVTSVYDLCASFHFKPAATSSPEADATPRLELVAQGEGGPEDLPQLMRFWLEEEGSVPGFLASVSLECYDRFKREKEMGS